MVNKQWIPIAICGWFVLNVFGVPFTAQGSNWVLLSIFLQQLWLFFCGWMAINKMSIFSWNIGDVIVGIVAGLAMFILNGLVGYGTVAGLSVVYGTETVTQWLAQERAGVESLLTSADQNTPWGLFFLVTLGASLSEEVFFRGAWLNSLNTVVSQKLAVILTALFFAAVHFYIIQFLPVFLSGIILGALFIRKKNLLCPIIAHIVVNILVFVLYVKSLALF